MTILMSKTPSFSENNVIKRFDRNHSLTPLRNMQIFRLYSRMTSLLSKKPPFEKRTSSNDKTKVLFAKDIWDF